MRPSAIVQRLKTRAQFQAAMSGGPVARTEHFALHRCALEQPLVLLPRRATALWPCEDTWVGAVLPRRWARRAVTRNAIRRQIYQVARGFEPRLGMAAHVVRLRSGFDPARYPSARSNALLRAVRGELEQLLQRTCAGLAS